MDSPPIDDFSILPLNLPADGPAILHLHYQSYLNESAIRTYPPEGPLTEPEFKKAHLPYLLEQFDKPANISAKLVTRTTPANPTQSVIGYIMLKPPGEVDKRSDAEKQQALRDEIEGMGSQSAEEKESTFEMMWKGKLLNEQLLGKGYEARYWLLDALFVDEEYQRKGLGTRLTRWGVDAVGRKVNGVRAGRAKKACCCKKDELEQVTNAKGSEKVEGIYLISSSVAQKTYLSCGFEKIGEFPAPGKEQEFIFSWYVKKF